MESATALRDGAAAPSTGSSRRSPGSAVRSAAAVDHVGAARAALERITALRSRISEMEETRVDVGALPTADALAPLLPGGAIRAGSVYAVQDSLLLVSAMLQAASASGAWCAIVGAPSFGVEAAAAAGIDLERLVLVPDPGDQWLGVTAALADVAAIVVTRPLGRVTPGNASRLAARLRQRGAALVSLGAWPGADVSLRVAERSWQGIGAGHGFIGECRAVVVASGRAGAIRPVTAELLLPAADGVVRAAPPATGATTTSGTAADVSAVGPVAARPAAPAVPVAPAAAARPAAPAVLEPVAVAS